MTKVMCLRTNEEKTLLLETMPIGAPAWLKSVALSTESHVFRTETTVASYQSAQWDSEHFGFPIGWLRLDQIPDFSGSDSDLYQPLLAAVVNDATLRHDAQLIYCRLSAGQPDVIHGLEAEGFRLMDQLVTLQGELRPASGMESVNFLRITSGDEALVSEIQEMSADTFRHSRFYRDRRLNVDRINAMYKLWVSSLIERGEILGVLLEDRLAGYVGFTRDQEAARIELITVAPWARGKGIGKALVRKVLSHDHGDCRLMKVGTQLENIEAMSLYTGLGLRIARVELSFHLWTNARGIL